MQPEIDVFAHTMQHNMRRTFTFATVNTGDAVEALAAELAPPELDLPRPAEGAV